MPTRSASPMWCFWETTRSAPGVVACKDMVSGEQTTLPFDETLQRIREGLALREQGSVIVE